MRDRKLMGVQHLTGSLDLGEFGESSVLTLTIRQVTNQRMSNMLEVHPHLVGPAGVQYGFNQCRCVECLEHGETRPGAAPAIFRYRHAFAV